VFGPIDATTRALRLASARTSTQCLEIELTHRAFDLRDFDDDGVVAFAIVFATGLVLTREEATAGGEAEGWGTGRAAVRTGSTGFGAGSGSGAD
jgi:hypothetical protein